MRLLLSRVCTQAIRRHGVRNVSEITDSMTPVQRRAVLKNHMDNLPVNAGPYMQVYTKKQTAYNINLLIGSVFCVVGFYLIMSTDVYYMGNTTNKPLNIEQYYKPETDLRYPFYLEVVEEGQGDDE